MKTSEGLEVVVGEQLLRIRMAFANAINDVKIPEFVSQEGERTFDEEHFSLAKKHVDEALEFYTPFFCEKVLRIVIAELEPKKKKYEQEVRRQEADNALLNAIIEWPAEKVEKLTSVLSTLVF